MTLSRPGKLELNKTVDAGQVRQSFSRRRSKSVAVEVRRKRTFKQADDGAMTEVSDMPPLQEETPQEPVAPVEPVDKDVAPAARTLTEQGTRYPHARFLEGARQAETEMAENCAEREAMEAKRRDEEKRQREIDERRREEEARRRTGRRRTPQA